MLNIITVGLGGFIGASLRYLFTLMPIGDKSIFPIKTFLINVIGAFIVGAIAAYAIKTYPNSPRLILFLQVGLCGGFTTFAAMVIELDYMIKGSHFFVAISYVLLTVTFGLLAVALANVIIQ